ncbi:MAG: PTS sugar transporter subunit IIA [Planctomycetota bacterium]|jgi:mannitol/fructose-specific phosphotransferase system IIA component (Ntr-type)
MNLTELLRIDAIKVPLAASDKRAAIDELVDLLAARELISQPQSLKDAVWQREQQRTTGIGEGLAIPHGKCKCADELRVAIGLPAQPMNFDAVDKKPVRLIVLLASPPDKTSDHIQALGRISRLMSSAQNREAAFTATSAEALYQVLAEAETAST